jgi:hypothetical protein
MPNTNDSHGESEIIFEDDKYLIVEPMDYDSYLYYAPDNTKLMWKDVRNGQLFCIVDKNAQLDSGVKTYMIFKDEDNKILYYNWNGGKLSRIDFLEVIPEDIKPQVVEVIGVGKIYELLTRIVNGEEVSSRELENNDESIYDFKFTPKAPFKSKIVLRFDESDYIELFDPSEDDMWFYNVITSRYDSYEWEDDYQIKQDFGEGYFFSQFNDENLEKIKGILSIILPSSVPLETEEQKSEAGQKLLEMFDNEIDNIISDYVGEHNQCKTRGFESRIKNDFCNSFYNYGIFTKYCLTEYFTSVGMLLALYDTMGDKTLTISELLFRIGSDMDITGWSEDIYEVDCEDFDQESFDSYASRYLDNIIEKLEDESQYEDIYEYSELYKRLDSRFKINTRNKTKTGREFFYRGINPANNRILVQVAKKDGDTEERSYSEEEFENFLVSPDLFESKKRRNIVLEQNTGKEVMVFISNLLKSDPNMFNTKKPLMYLQNKLSEYKSKNPRVTLDMTTLIKQLSKPESPFKFTTFNIQTYEPKRISTLDVNLKNIGFTITKSDIDPMSIQGGVKLKF